MTRRSMVVLSLAAGGVFSWGKLAYHCRRPIEEAARPARSGT